jgi:hypothetical protein
MQNLDELARFGFVHRISDWNLYVHNGESANKATFQLLAPAYTYDEDNDLFEQQTVNNTNINVYGNMHNSQIQQSTNNSTQIMAINETIDFIKVLELFDNILGNIDTFNLSDEDNKELQGAISEAAPIAKIKGDSTVIKKSLYIVKDIMLRASGSLVAHGVLFGLQQLGVI